MPSNLEFYRTFYYTARFNSITAAAKALYLTQPTVTHAIHALEEELGCLLFIRSHKGVTLTPEGELLYEHTKAAFEHLADARTRLTSRLELQEGSIRMGASETTLHHFLLPALQQFRTLHPGIKFRITSYNTPSAIEAIRAGHIDLAVLVMLRKEPSDTGLEDGLQITHLTGLEDIFIAGSSYTSLRKPSVTPEEMLQYPFICMEKGSLTRRFLDDFFLSHQLTLDPDMELATADLITPLAAGNMGIGLVPEVFARKALSEGSVFRIQQSTPLPKREICAITRKNAPLSVAASAFVSELVRQKL